MEKLYKAFFIMFSLCLISCGKTHMFDQIKVGDVIHNRLEYGTISFTLSKSAGFVWNNLNIPVVEDGSLIGVLQIRGGSGSKGLNFIFDKEMAEEFLAKNGVLNPELPNGEAIPVSQLPFAKTWIFKGPEGIHIYLNANPRVEKMLIGFAVPIKELSKVSATVSFLSVFSLFQVPIMYNAVQALISGSSGLYFNPVTRQGGICSFVEVPNIIHKRKGMEKISFDKNKIGFSEKGKVSLSEYNQIKEALGSGSLNIGLEN